MPLLPPWNARCVWLGLILAVSTCRWSYAQFDAASDPSAASKRNLRVSIPEDPDVTRQDSTGPVDIDYQLAFRFTDEGDSVLLMRGCTLTQGTRTFAAPNAVLWSLPPDDQENRRFLVYFEATSERLVEVVERNPARTRHVPDTTVEIVTATAPRFSEREPVDLSQLEDPFYKRARQQRRQLRSELEKTQYVITQQPGLPAPGFVPPGGIPALPPQPMVRRHVTIGPRFLGGDPFTINAQPSPYNTVPPEYIVTVTGGVNIVVDNVPLEIDGQILLTRVDLSADRAVVWTDDQRLAQGGSIDINDNAPFQVYLEGNIVVRQGTSEARASHAFYDVNQRRGLLLNAEIRTFVNELEGTLRLRAAEVRQYSESSFHAKDAWFTTSQFGHPKWRLQASDIYLEQRQDPFSSRINPATGQRDDSVLWVTGINSRLFVEDVPLLALPYISGPAEDPNIPIRRFNVGYSGLFGWELDTQWNMEGLLGLNLPSGVDWNLDLDYFSERGPAIGTSGEYDLFGDFLGLPARYSGSGDAYVIYDNGHDNLGLDRRDLAPPEDIRGRVLWRNRVDLPFDAFLMSEVGHIFSSNDRNFLEQYYEGQWDTDKDFETRAILGQNIDNLTGSLLLGARTYDFENQTEWLPKLDLTILGEPIFGSPLTWSSHSSVGYGRLRPADAPVDPLADPFVPLNNPATALPYITDSQGLVAMTRHELSLPFYAGPMNIVPYALGEVAYWQEDVTQSDLARFYGSAGVRGSIQFSKYMPQVQDPILGLNGLAHKLTLDFDYYFAESSENLSRIPQYNDIDDNAQERFRERYIPLEFGGALPLMFDPRNYALRSGTGRGVSTPYHELVDDQQALWLGMHHRWQTKVGPFDRPRIIDWAEWSVRAGFFPDADRDNFGEDFGLVTSNAAWHISPRTSLVSQAAFDFFDTGQNVWSVGALSQRSTRGSVYLGYRQVNVGPIESQLVSGSFSYVMSPNLYVATFGASYDIAEGIDRGQSLTVTRIGEYFLLHFGLGYDRSRDNVGVALSLEPKFGGFGSGSMQLNSLLGIQ